MALKMKSSARFYGIEKGGQRYTYLVRYESRPK